MFLVFSVCRSVCKKNNLKSCQWILMKLVELLEFGIGRVFQFEWKFVGVHNKLLYFMSYKWNIVHGVRNMRSHLHKASISKSLMSSTTQCHNHKTLIMS